MEFHFLPYSSEQRRNYLDSVNLYALYLERQRHYLHSYRYAMIWQESKGITYLAKLTGDRKRHYLGQKSGETEAIHAQYTEARNRLAEEIHTLQTKLHTRQKINKALLLGHTPNPLVTLYDKINQWSLDEKLILVGTNALYAYEAAAGLFLEAGHLATEDIDILSKKSKRISLIAREIMPAPKISDMIKSIDRSFTLNPKAPYQYINKYHVMLEIINPLSHKMGVKGTKEFDRGFTDIIPLEMEGMEWLESSRLFRATVVGENGKMAALTTIHPLDFAIYKHWLGNQNDRNRLKAVRDLEQSRLVTQLMLEHLPQIDVKAELDTIRHFKRELLEGYRNRVYEPLYQSQRWT